MPISGLTTPPWMIFPQLAGLWAIRSLIMGQTQQTENIEEIDVKAIQDMYKKFVMECPIGRLFLHEFKRFFGVHPTGEASEYAENMFRAFDRNGVRERGNPKARHVAHLHANVEIWWCRSPFAFQDNTIDFLEFVAALNLVFRGDLEHKLRWSFKVYDKDNNGYVDRSELRSIIDVSLWKRSATVTCVVDVGHSNTWL